MMVGVVVMRPRIERGEAVAGAGAEKMHQQAAAIEDHPQEANGGVTKSLMY